MIRGTTPTHTFTFSVDLSDVKDFVITYAQQGKIVLEKKKNDCSISENKIVVTLTQEETLAFDHGTMVEMQAKVLTTGGTVLASNIFTTHADRILNEEVLA